VFECVWLVRIIPLPAGSTCCDRSAPRKKVTPSAARRRADDEALISGEMVLVHCLASASVLVTSK
jgi:hypothetical protein